MANDDQSKPRQAIPQKLQGNQGEVLLEKQLLKSVPHNYNREQAHGENRPDFMLHDDAGENIAVVDSKRGLQVKDGRSWTDRAQARAFLKIASETKSKTLLLATADGTDRKFSAAVKAELRDQPAIPPEKRVTVIVDTVEGAGTRSKQLVDKANENLTQPAEGPAEVKREIVTGPSEAPSGDVNGPQVEVVQKDAPAGPAAAPAGPAQTPAAPAQAPVMPVVIDIPPGGRTG